MMTVVKPNEGPNGAELKGQIKNQDMFSEELIKVTLIKYLKKTHTLDVYEFYNMLTDENI